MVEAARGEPNGRLRRACRAAFDRWEQFASRRSGVGLMFAWALAEATVWPIIADFLLVPMAVGNRRRFYVSWAASTMGMALGGIITYLFALRQPNAAFALLRRLPMVDERGIDRVRRRLAQDGIRAYLVQPWSGIPFKVWGVMGGSMRLDPLLAIPTFVTARALRMAIVATAAGLAARRFARLLRDFSLLLLIGYLVVFFYGLRRLRKRG